MNFGRACALEDLILDAGCDEILQAHKSVLAEKDTGHHN